MNPYAHVTPLFAANTPPRRWQGTAARRRLAVIPPPPPCADLRVGGRGLPTGTTADALGRICRTRPGRPRSLFLVPPSLLRSGRAVRALRRESGRMRPLRERPDRIIRRRDGRPRNPVRNNSRLRSEIGEASNS